MNYFVKTMAGSFSIVVLFQIYRQKIGKNYGRSRTTVNDWKLAALKQLRKEWARLEHEEQKSNTF